MKRAGLIIAILAMVGVLAYLNHGMGVETGADQNSASQSPPTKAASKQDPPSTSSSGVNPLPPEEILGNPLTSKYLVRVGWDFNSQNQSQKQPLIEMLTAVRQFVLANQGTSAVIADIDVPPSDRTPMAQSVTHLGVSINGHSIPSLIGDPGEGSVTAASFVRQLPSLTR